VSWPPAYRDISSSGDKLSVLSVLTAGLTCVIPLMMVVQVLYGYVLGVCAMCEGAGGRKVQGGGLEEKGCERRVGKEKIVPVCFIPKMEITTAKVSKLENSMSFKINSSEPHMQRNSNLENHLKIVSKVKRSGIRMRIKDIKEEKA
jgi:hypothetical protein